jgi:formamidopyrimidine-DNA glycosylase
VPELPEVETIRRGLQEALPGKRIRSVEVAWAGVLKNLSPYEFEARLIGRVFRHVGRRGKYLLLHVEGAQLLVVHLRMTGGFSLCPPEEPRRNHTHWVLGLDDGRELRFRDPRKFGLVYLLEEDRLASFPPLAGLGPEPLSRSFSTPYLARVLSRSSRKVKEVLLDQTKIAGVGNIYADEALFLARVHPARLADSLRPSEVLRLRRGIQQVLTHSIQAQGRSFSDYCQLNGEEGDYHPLVHDNISSLCPHCGNPLEKIRVGGRGTYFCSRCQR